MNNTIKTAIFVFLFVTGIYTMTINSWNAKYFSLQSATVALLTEKGTFALSDQAIPGFNLVEGDETFRYEKQVYPMKQPGQTVLGSIVYYPLYKLGIDFTHHYDYAVHIITLFTSVIMMAGVATLIYFIAYYVTKSERLAQLPAYLFAFGTIVWPYAGVMHHDIYAMFFAFISVFSYLWYLYKQEKTSALLVAGFSAGLALFFSMLPMTLVVGLLLFAAVRRKFKELVSLTIGIVAGLVPSFIFNFQNFGGILAFPNLAGKVADTVPIYSISNFLNHIEFYLLSQYSLFAYSPIMIFALMGIFLMPTKYSEAKKLIIIISTLQLIHICTQTTYGGFQYGPRYLLSIMPAISLGIIFYLMKMKSTLAHVIFGVVFAYSICVALIGALQTVMYPVPGAYGPYTLLLAIFRGELPEFRLLVPGAMIAIIILIKLKKHHFS